MPLLAERVGVLEAKRGELASIFAAHAKDGVYDMPQAVLEDVRARNEELSRLQDELKAAQDLAAVEQRNAQALAALSDIKRPGGNGAGSLGPAGASGLPVRRDVAPVERRTLGDLFVESATFLEYRGGRGPVSVHPDFDLKTLFSTTAGWDPEDLRTGRLVFDEQQPAPIVADVVPKTTTRMSTVLYMEETTYTNNAAEVSEGGTYGEAALALTEQSSEVRKIGVWLPVTDEQFEDEPRARDYVNNRLRNMLRQRLDQQLLTGNGTAPNLRGVLNVTGINTQAKGADPTPDAIYKAIVLCRVNGFAEPNACVLHPNDWQDIRLLRTADGIYIWGSPSEMGMPRIWGLPVIQTTYETQNTGLVGDFRNYCELALRRGIEFEVTNSHSTYFIEGKKAIRADMRAAFLVYRPKAFATITGI